MSLLESSFFVLFPIYGYKSTFEPFELQTGSLLYWFHLRMYQGAKLPLVTGGRPYEKLYMQLQLIQTIELFKPIFSSQN